jgi:hypothetical protein
MFAVDALVLFSGTSVGLTPATEALKDTSLPLVVHLPEATISAMMGVIGCATIFLGISGIFKELFSLIFKVNSLLSIIYAVRLKPIGESVPSFRPRLNISNDSRVILSGNLPLPRGISKTS